MRRLVELKCTADRDEIPDSNDSDDENPDGANLSSCSIQASSTCSLRVRAFVRMFEASKVFCIHFWVCNTIIFGRCVVTNFADR
jgi:hypothetical protein